QQRIARRGGAPLVVPRLFRHRSFVAGIVLSGAFFAIASGFFLMLALFLQVGLGYGVLKAGLTGIPFSIGVSAAAGLSGPVLVPRFGRSIISTGVLVMALGLALFGVTADYFGGEVTPWQLAPALLICGAGMGFVVAPVYPFILAEVPIPDAGSASGIINAVGQIGGAMGVAAIGVIFFGLIADRADTSVASVRPALATELEASGLPPFAVPTVLVQFESCFRDRATAKDFSAAPESCRAGAAAQAAFAASQPAVAAAVAESMTRFGRTANQRNFTGAMARSLLWEIGALVVLFFVSFLLPRQPREEAALAAI
ncbi:MAG: MFS transporter, partial [Alphaproteobacteria bacterium]|nr:MFS transporter [Alphaproteobacteria bacterium]